MEILLESFKPFDAVFLHADQADKFYIVLSGEVYILIPKVKANTTSTTTTFSAENNLLDTISDRTQRINKVVAASSGGSGGDSPAKSKKDPLQLVSPSQR